MSSRGHVKTLVFPLTDVFWNIDKVSQDVLTDE